MSMVETPWRFYREHGVRYRIKAEYGIDYAFARRTNQSPDFTIQGTIDRQAGNNRWMDDAGGQVTEEIVKYIPRLAPYLKWNGVGPDGPSLHYIENAKYWLEIAQGKRTPTHLDNADAMLVFKEIIKLGAFPGDVVPDFRGPKEWSPRGLKGDLLHAPWRAVEAWLEGRLPKMAAAWVVDMSELGVLE